MAYDKLSIEEFGEHLLTTGDLDPIYIALVKAEFTPQELKRFLVGYWCFYHAGVACYLAEQPDYWPAIYKAGRNEEPTPLGGRWPRGSERRHFRGKQAMLGLESISSRHDQPEAMVDYIIGDCSNLRDPISFASINARAQEYRGFGPWISFKIGDMIDRCGLAPVDFTLGEVFMFKDPKQAALKLWHAKTGTPTSAKLKDTTAAVREVVEYLSQQFSHHKAPPLYDRPVSLQEVETILCKWKSHMNGHYPLLNDTIEINQGLAEWLPHSNMAARFAAAMPTGAPL